MISKRFLIGVCLLVVSFQLIRCHNDGSSEESGEGWGNWGGWGTEHFKETVVVKDQPQITDTTVKVDIVEDVQKEIVKTVPTVHEEIVTEKREYVSLEREHSRSEEDIEIIEHNIDKEIAIADDGDKERSTLGGFLDQILFDPIGSLLEYLKNLLQRITIDLDEFLLRIFQALANLINGLLEVIITIPLALIDILGDLVPGVLGNLVDEMESKTDECAARYPLDPINDTLLELEECVTDPVYHIVEDLSIVLTDVQKVLIILDGGVEEIEESMHLTGVLGGVLDILQALVAEVLEILADLVAGPIADILIALPELLACILGDLGKNLLGQIIALIMGYVKCLSELI